MTVNTYEKLRPIADVWDWQHKGNCVGKNTELFFLETSVRGPNKTRQENEAKAICKGCPVKNKCLNHALTTPEYYGVWGGLSADERSFYSANRREIA